MQKHTSASIIEMPAPPRSGTLLEGIAGTTRASTAIANAHSYFANYSEVISELPYRDIEQAVDVL